MPTLVGRGGQKYRVLEKIGAGSFGTVYLVQADGELQVVKILSWRRSARATERALQEVGVLEDMQHPNIVRLFSAFPSASRRKLCIVMEHCEDGDLNRHIKAARAARTPFAEAQVLDWFAQLALALAHLHANRILHRDIKAQNVFLCHGMRLAKLGDFGLVKELDGSGAMASTKLGTPYYLSPEMCRDEPYNYPSDVWALGVLLYRLLALRMPFEAKAPAELYRGITGSEPPPLPSRYSPALRRLVARMLDKRPERRPTARDLLASDVVRAHVTAVVEALEPAAPAPDAPAPADDARSDSAATSAAASDGFADTLSDLGSGGDTDVLGSAASLRRGRRSHAVAGRAATPPPTPHEIDEDRVRLMYKDLIRSGARALTRSMRASAKAKTAAATTTPKAASTPKQARGKGKRRPARPADELAASRPPQLPPTHFPRPHKPSEAPARRRRPRPRPQQPQRLLVRPSAAAATAAAAAASGGDSALVPIDFTAMAPPPRLSAQQVGGSRRGGGGRQPRRPVEKPPAAAAPAAPRKLSIQIPGDDDGGDSVGPAPGGEPEPAALLDATDADPAAAVAVAAAPAEATPSPRLQHMWGGFSSPKSEPDPEESARRASKASEVQQAVRAMRDPVGMG